MANAKRETVFPIFLDENLVKVEERCYLSVPEAREKGILQTPVKTAQLTRCGIQINVLPLDLIMCSLGMFQGLGTQAPVPFHEHSGWNCQNLEATRLFFGGNTTQQ